MLREFASSGDVLCSAASVSASKRRIHRVRFQWVVTALGDVLCPAPQRPAAYAAAGAITTEQSRSPNQNPAGDGGVSALCSENLAIALDGADKGRVFMAL